MPRDTNPKTKPATLTDALVAARETAALLLAYAFLASPGLRPADPASAGCAMNIDAWLDEHARMAVQDLAAMRPTDRAVFAVAAAAHRDALAAVSCPDARRLSTEFGWLFDAAVGLQEGA